MPTLLTEAWRSFAPRAADRSLGVTFETEPASVVTDLALLRSILADLFDNAVDYAPSGGAVRIACRSLPDGHVEFRVANSTEHLEPEDVARLFERFWRKENSRPPSTHVGLGLPLARAFADTLGWEFAAHLHHEFDGDGHELNVEVRTDRSAEPEDNHYVTASHTPATADAFESIRITAKVRDNDVTVEYVRPLGKEEKLEAGYTLENDRDDQDFHAETAATANGPWLTDATRSNRFRADLKVHAAYVTYGRTFGRFGFLGGARVEQAFIDSLLVNTGVTVPNDYFRFYPSLHLTYALADSHELQLNYSHRIHRPEIDDLNPFSEYQDPTHLRAGNPRLKPEDIHSFEIGHQFRRGDTSLVTTAYYRYLYHGLTDVTTLVTPTTLLTTKSNLATSRALGVKFAANSPVTKWATLNLSSNTFFNPIDASNLGLSPERSAVSWMAKLGLSLHPSKATLVQFNTGYTSSKLTAQGRRGASYVSSIGVRHDLIPSRLALTLTVSDLFNSLKKTTVLDTPTLHEEIVRRRSARIVYVGCLCKFGKAAKKPKDEALRFDEGL